jgi:uncharacterized protein YndB with AHSA1/START domain
MIKLISTLLILSFIPIKNKISKMEAANFTTSITLDQSPEAVFNALTNVRGWWSEEIDGATSKQNDEFVYHFEDVHRAKIKLTTVIPNKKVEWLILENYFKFTKDKNEWTGDKIIFEIAKKGNKTQLTMTQIGLTPEYECYEICRGAWTNYIQISLYQLITTGKGKPNAKGKPQTADEKKLSGQH